MKKAVVSISSNSGRRWESMSKAIKALEHLPGSTTVIACSKVYENQMFSHEAYLNMCVILMTELSSRALFGACMGIESALGRTRMTDNGECVIGLDLIAYEGEGRGDCELQLSDEEIRKKEFMLVPLADLFPDKKIFGFNFASAYENLNKEHIVRV